MAPRLLFSALPRTHSTNSPLSSDLFSPLALLHVIYLTPLHLCLHLLSPVHYSHIYISPLALALSLSSDCVSADYGIYIRIIVLTSTLARCKYCHHMVQHLVDVVCHSRCIHHSRAPHSFLTFSVFTTFASE